MEQQLSNEEAAKKAAIEAAALKYEELRSAITDGNWEKGEELLKEVDDVAINDLITHFTAKDRVSALKFLTEQVTFDEERINRIINWSIKRGNIDSIKFALGSFPDHANLNEMLASAVGTKHFEIVKFLVESGADVNHIIEERQGGCIINKACQFSTLEVVKYLQEKGAEFIEEYGLYFLMKEGHYEYVKSLKETLPQTVFNSTFYAVCLNRDIAEAAIYMIENELIDYNNRDFYSVFSNLNQGFNYKVATYLCEKHDAIDYVIEHATGDFLRFYENMLRLRNLFS